MGRHSKDPGQSDVPLYGSQMAVDATNPDLASTGPKHARNVLAARSEPHRGILAPASPLPTEDDTVQVWSMDLIKLQDTNWFGAEGPKTVGEILPAMVDKVSKWDEYDILKKSMQQYGQQVPIRMFRSIPPLPGKLRDGMNRIALAELMGWDSMLVTFNIMEKSMWEDWDKSEMGIAFHNAKAARMGVR